MVMVRYQIMRRSSAISIRDCCDLSIHAATIPAPITLLENGRLRNEHLLVFVNVFIMERRDIPFWLMVHNFKLTIPGNFL